MALSADYVRSRIDYDPETGALTWKARLVRNSIDKMWNTRFAGTPITHKQSSGYIHLGLDGKNYLGQHIAWLITYGVWPSLRVDHENRIRDDNRLRNLRAATSAQNNSNTKLYSSNSSGFRGVWLQNGKWLARIRVNYKGVYLGAFDTASAAAEAYDEAALKYHGDFASLNFRDIGGSH